MKAKYYFGIILILLLTASTVKAQRNDPGYNSNDDARLVVNNYYNDNDYDYTSRINRFHRPYAAFDYYSPVFTEPYGYNYHRPWSLGLGIYGGLGLGFGLNLGYGDSYGYDPYFGDNYYGGYDPFYYNSWFSPFMFNFNFGYNWRNNFWGWNSRYHNYGYNDYRSNYYSRNDYHGYNTNRYSYSGSPSRRNPGNVSESSSHYNNVPRRTSSSGIYARNEINSNRSAVRSENGTSTGETRRVTSIAVNRGQGADTRNSSYSGIDRTYGNTSTNVHNSRNINTGANTNRYNNTINHGINNNRMVRSNTGTYSRSSGTSNTHQARSFSSRSVNSGSGIRSSSSHSSSRSSGSKSGSSGGRSSGRR
jgi:hypothetical protein